MGFLEERVERLGKRVQKMKAHPDPRKAVSNVLFYEAELEKEKAQIVARDEGRPFALTADMWSPLTKAMGFSTYAPSHAADRIVPEKLQYYTDEANKLEIPDYYCDRMVLCVPLILREGGLPLPKVILSSDVGCELHGLAFSLIGHLGDIPFFHIYYPFEYDYKPYLGYITGQLQEFIAFAEEKVPGVKYDENKLRDLLGVLPEWFALNNQIFELRKTVPCPDHPQDVFREVQYPCGYPNPQKILDYMRAYRDELSAKVERGYSPVKEERLRLMWTTTGPHNNKVWDLLLERGVPVPYVMFGLSARYYGVGYPGVGDTTEFGRKLSPLEEVARPRLGNSFGGTAKMWIDQALRACRECKIDAIINFDQVGCTPVTGYSRLLKDAAEREMGIPSLNIVGREKMWTKQDEEQFLDQVDNFITRCLKRKGF